jgi:hypothetical protein
MVIVKYLKRSMLICYIALYYYKNTQSWVLYKDKRFIYLGHSSGDPETWHPHLLSSGEDLIAHGTMVGVCVCERSITCSDRKQRKMVRPGLLFL